MKLAIIGDSHTGAWKLAWDRIADAHADFDLTFFAARGQKTLGLQVDAGKLVADDDALRKSITHTSGGMEQIDPHLFDAFVVCGLLTIKVSLVDAPQYSSGLYKQMLADVLTASANYKIALKIRKITDKPIYICHRPLPIPQEGREGFIRDTYAQRIEMLNDFAQRDIDARVVAQAEQTIVDERHTLKAFSIGSRRLDVGSASSGTLHEPEDRTHMNEDFGVIALENLFATLR